MSEEASRLFQASIWESPPVIPVFSVEFLDIIEQRQAISTVYWLNFQPTGSMNIIKRLFYTTEFWNGNQNIDLRDF